MVAADTSTIAAFLGGHDGPDVEQLAHALSLGSLVLPAIVTTELLSRPGLNESTIAMFTALPRLAIEAGYFARTGRLRRQVRAKRLRARLADALIAQSCIDANVALITRDSDFRHFAAHCGLKLA